MPRKKLIWQIYPTYLLIIVMCVVGATWYSSRTLRIFYLRQMESGLESRARLVESQIHGHMDRNDAAYVDLLCDELEKRSSTRITVILANGEVIGDSERNPANMGNHSNRPEIMETITGGTGSSVRYSRTLEQTMLYVAIPVEKNGKTVGTVRVAMPISSIDDMLGLVYKRIALGGVVIAFLAAAAGLAMSRRFSRPLEEIKRGTERLAGGDMSYRLPSYDSEEAGSLADAVNAMASELQERMNTIVSQGKRQEAILASMTEGVLAVDTERRLIDINRAATDMLSVDASESIGRTVEEVIRRPALQRFIEKALASRKIVEDDIVVLSDEERHFRVRGAPLTDVEGGSIGAVVVLNDLTKIRRLENIRRDFVANVSHELKTPITAVKGFVETLREGAIRDPKEAERFLGIVGKQADRLDAIIEDLLELSRIEKESESVKISPEECLLCEVIQSAVQLCEHQASKKALEIRVVCEKETMVLAGRHLLERAITNLVDNAIKYSNEGSAVTVEAKESESEIAVSIRDTGCGIAKEHLPRLFERFYRVDKARSRKLGGTGLGLAIVKHVARDHGGSVTVESEPGKGSTFTIHLPKRCGAKKT